MGNSSLIPTDRANFTMSKYFETAALTYFNLNSSPVEEDNEELMEKMEDYDLHAVTKENLKNYNLKELEYLVHDLSRPYKLAAQLGLYFTAYSFGIFFTLRRQPRFIKVIAGGYSPSLLRFVARGSILGTMIFSVLFSGIYLIVRHNQAVEKFTAKKIVFEEIIRRKAKYDKNVREAVLGNALRFYNFPEETVIDILSQVNSNLKEQEQYHDDLVAYYEDQEVSETIFDI